MRLTLLYCVFASMALLSGRDTSPAATPSSEATPVGRWKTVDDATGKDKSLITIWEEQGKVYGKIEKILDPSSHDPNPRCGHCPGELKNQPLIGLRILWDFKKNGAEWTGGRVLDPESGKIYRCLISVEDGGKRLKVRGFVGFSLFGRTQYWLRDEKP
jgi:uncharacterized protein (DUF2147 family)